MSSTRRDKSGRARLLKGTLATTVLAAAVSGLLGAAPAHAAAPWEQVDHDGVSVDGGHSDFGNDPHLAGKPWPYSGSVTFFLKDGQVRAVVSGRTYLDDLAGHTARTLVRYEQSNGGLIAQEVGGQRYSSFDGLRATDVWTQRHTDRKIARVTILTQIKGAGGDWRTTGSETVRLDDA